MFIFANYFITYTGFQFFLHLFFCTQLYFQDGRGTIRNGKTLSLTADSMTSAPPVSEQGLAFLDKFVGSISTNLGRRKFEGGVNLRRAQIQEIFSLNWYFHVFSQLSTVSKIAKVHIFKEIDQIFDRLVTIQISYQKG